MEKSCATISLPFENINIWNGLKKFSFKKFASRNMKTYICLVPYYVTQIHLIPQQYSLSLSLLFGWRHFSLNTFKALGFSFKGHKRKGKQSLNYKFFPYLVLACQLSTSFFFNFHTQWVKSEIAMEVYKMLLLYLDLINRFYDENTLNVSDEV